ncbi:RAMP superfamily CRISPR-associated protein, partial [Mangrovimonas sp. TPBH4]|uniref:RAMP superfamily CRISPR-associated protein n=1 Tax=Mangrovimonas sp. TPBH4 TaxID=1645914 RepID=UPI000A41B5EA
MSNVKSTYNFVPAPTEQEVFCPDWGEQISHDIPFSDGESGEIELKITAQTPIFIRNGHAKNNAETEFSHVEDEHKNKHYYIPGSSLKGMVRNVLEIMSFSRLNKNLVNNHRYAFRDLSSAKNEYMTSYKKFDIKAGWLTEDTEGKWKIEECEDLAFITHQELKENRNIPFRDLFLNEDPKGKTAKWKYDLVKQMNLTGEFTTFQEKLFGGVFRNKATFLSGGKKGTLVFTGQSGKRKEREGQKASGKNHEFVFFDAEKPTYLDVPENDAENNNK